MPILMHCSDEAQAIIHPYLEQLSMFPQQIYIYQMDHTISFSKLTQQQLNENCRYIFIIENGDFILQILDLKPLTIWRQQFLKEDIEASIKDVRYHPDIILRFQSGKNTLCVNASHIIYIESYLHYLIIHTASTTFKVRDKISNTMLRLKEYGFIQIHRSYLINLNYLVAYTDKNCLLAHQIELPLGDKFKNQLP